MFAHPERYGTRPFFHRKITKICVSVAGRKTRVWELVGARRDELHKTSARAVNRIFFALFLVASQWLF